MSDKLDPKMKPINGLAARVVFGEAVHYEPARKLTQAYTEIPPIETDQKRIASIAASLTKSGVSKSGSPAERPITSTPLALRSSTRLVIARVAEG